MQLSKLESQAYEELEKNKITLFTSKDLALLINIDKTKAYNIIKALKKKKAIIIIGKKKYALYGTNEFELASELNYPSYISFLSALNYYGFSDNIPKKIFVATTKYSKDIYSFKYVTLSKKRFFGYVSIGKIVMAEKEKALIDCLLFPKYAGGIKEIRKAILSSIKSLDRKKLIDYALRVESRAVIRRLGFLLEEFQFKDSKILKKNIGAGYELLDPTLKKKNNLNKKWLLDINI